MIGKDNGALTLMANNEHLLSESMTSEKQERSEESEEEFTELEEELRDVEEAREKARKRKRGPYRKASVGGRTKLD